jgi:hypothetical protein
MTVEEMVEEHLKASERNMKRVLASREASRRYLIRAGVWSKLPKPTKSTKKCAK